VKEHGQLKLRATEARDDPSRALARGARLARPLQVRNSPRLPEPLITTERDRDILGTTYQAAVRALMLDVRFDDGAQAAEGRLGLGSVPMILMYHGVADVAEDPYQLYVTPSRFAEQMTWLKRQGLRGVGIGTLVDAMRAGQAHGLVGISFDDGYVSVLESALPELLRHGFTASMFIISDLLGGTNQWDEGPVWPLMSAEQVRELATAGMEIASHSATHVRLSRVGADRLEAEISGSRASLSELMGVPVRGFAYPWGSNDAAARRAVSDAGYEYACAVETPVAELGLMTLPRICFTQQDGTGRMTAKHLLLRPYTAISGTRRQIARSPFAQAIRQRLSGRPGFRS
jgi:peptidoglycan/xylan/chitin deacetylase (PgdA/CDA1 family)